ncbi:MAG: hypothetical protein ACLRP3_05735 [Escherichia sp.]
MNWRRIVWLLALVTLPTLAEETPLQLALRGAHDQLYQLSSSGVTKVSALPDTLTTPLGSLWNCMFTPGWRIPINRAALPIVAETPGRGLLLSGWESITRDTRWYAPVDSILRRSGCILAQMCGAILATASGTCVVSVSYYAEARNLGNG